MERPTMRSITWRHCAAVLLALALAGCASYPRINVASDPEADFGRYATFAFLDPLGTDRPDGTGTMLSQTLKRAARRELESLGYTYDAANPDLTLNFFVETREVIESRNGPVTVWGGYGVYHRTYGVWTDYGNEIRQYTESTLHVDVIDSERDQLVWEAISTDRLKDHDLTYETGNVEGSVAKIFAGFPLRRPGS